MRKLILTFMMTSLVAAGALAFELDKPAGAQFQAEPSQEQVAAQQQAHAGGYGVVGHEDFSKGQEESTTSDSSGDGVLAAAQKSEQQGAAALKQVEKSKQSESPLRYLIYVFGALAVAFGGLTWFKKSVEKSIPEPIAKASPKTKW